MKKFLDQRVPTTPLFAYTKVVAQTKIFFAQKVIIF